MYAVLYRELKHRISANDEQTMKKGEGTAQYRYWLACRELSVTAIFHEFRGKRKEVIHTMRK
jgi:hypothetical protein